MGLFDKKIVVKIEEEDLKDAKLSSMDYSDEIVKKRAFIDVLGARLAIKMLFSKKLEASNVYSLYTIHSLLEDLDIADIYYGGMRIDVRLVFNRNEIFIPKKHFEYDLLPHLYLVLELNSDFSSAEFLGFFEPDSINKENQNDDFYFFDYEKLNAPGNLKSFVKRFKVPAKLDISPENFEKANELFLSAADKDITFENKLFLFKQLSESFELREKMVEFENFEIISKEIAKNDAIVGDGVLEIIGAQKVFEEEEQLQSKEDAKAEIIGEVLNDLLDEDLAENEVEKTPEQKQLESEFLSELEDENSLDSSEVEVAEESVEAEESALEYAEVQNTESEEQPKSEIIENAVEAFVAGMGLSSAVVESVAEGVVTEAAEIIKDTENVLSDIAGVSASTAKALEGSTGENVGSAGLPELDLTESLDAPDYLNQLLEESAENTENSEQNIEDSVEEEIEFVENSEFDLNTLVDGQTDFVEDNSIEFSVDEISEEIEDALPQDEANIAGDSLEEIEDLVLDNEAEKASEDPVFDVPEEIEVLSSDEEENVSELDFSLEELEPTGNMQQNSDEQEAQQAEMLDEEPPIEDESQEIEDLDTILDEIEITAEAEDEGENSESVVLPEIEGVSSDELSEIAALENYSQDEQILEEPLNIETEEIPLAENEPNVEVENTSSMPADAAFENAVPETLVGEPMPELSPEEDMSLTALPELDFNSLDIQEKESTADEKDETFISFDDLQEETPPASLSEVQEEKTAPAQTQEELTFDAIKSHADAFADFSVETIPFDFGANATSVANNLDQGINPEEASENKITQENSEIPEITDSRAADDSDANSDSPITAAVPPKEAKNHQEDVYSAREVKERELAQREAMINGGTEQSENSYDDVDPDYVELDVYSEKRPENRITNEFEAEIAALPAEIELTAEEEAFIANALKMCEEGYNKVEAGLESAETEEEENGKEEDLIEDFDVSDEKDPLQVLYQQEKSKELTDMDFKGANHIIPLDLLTKNKKMVIAASVAAVVLASFTIGGMVAKNNSAELAKVSNMQQTPIEAGSQDPNLAMNADNAVPGENLDGMESGNSGENQAGMDTSLPGQVSTLDSLTQQAVENQQQSGIEQDMGKVVSNAFTSEPVSASVSKIAWEVPEDLAYNDAFRKYLQVAGKNLKLNLQTDLLLATEMAYSNRILIDLVINKNGSIQSSNVVASSGSKQVDKIVLQSVKETLKYLKMPASELGGGYADATLIINF